MTQTVWKRSRVRGLERFWGFGGSSGRIFVIMRLTPVFGAMGEISGAERRLRLPAAQNDGDVRLCSPHGGHQRADAHDGHDALEIVGQHVQGHFGPDVFQRLHLEMGVAHP